MGENSRNMNGHVGNSGGPTNYFKKQSMGNNSQNMNGNVPKPADVKDTGVWDK